MENGVICALEVAYYLVDGTIRAKNEEMTASRFAFDNGAGFDII